MRTLPAHLLLAAFLLVGASACSSGSELSPAPSANEIATADDAAATSAKGVRIRVQSDTWPGDLPVRRTITPIQVTIENDSDRPLRLRYDQFALVSSEGGTRYSAIPPYNVEGEITEPVVARDYTPVSDPYFTYTGFTVAPYYANLYPTLDPYADPFYHDPLYYDAYDTYWAEIGLPTEDMLRRALPEGVIAPGGEVQGFLYFEEVDPDLDRVEFRAQLVDPRTGNMFETLTVPFTVMEE